MTQRFRCWSRHLLTLTIVSLVGTAPLAESQIPGDRAPTDASSDAPVISPREIRNRSTEILRSASDFAQTAVDLSSQVGSDLETETSDIWVERIRSTARALRAELKQNIDHMEALEQALLVTAVERSPDVTKAPSNSDVMRSDDAEQLAALRVSRDDLAAALAAAEKIIEIEAHANQTEAERRQAAEAEADALAEQVVAAAKEIGALQVTQRELRATSAEMRAELDQTHEKLGNIETESAILRSDVQNCRQEVKICSQEKATLDPQDLSGKLKTAEQQLAGLLAVRDNLSAEVEDATSTAEQCAAILSRSDGRLAPALNEIERLEAALAAEQRRNEALTAELAAKQ